MYTYPKMVYAAKNISLRGIRIAFKLKNCFTIILGSPRYMEDHLLICVFPSIDAKAIEIGERTDRTLLHVNELCS